jgi:radical SAM-linked protein
LQQAFREIGEGEELPWEIVSYKIDRDYFLKERHKAYQAGETEECKDARCSACGVCDFDAMRNLLAAPATSPRPEPATGLLQGLAGARVRLGYRKTETVRFISHLDVLREIERTLRRAETPVLYSEGFSPRPKISAGPPLALGWTSDAEWVDVDLAGEWDDARLALLLEQLNTSVAPGLQFFVAGNVASREDSLVAQIRSGTYVATLPNPPFATTLGDLESAVRQFLALDRVMVRRERKTQRGQETRVRELDIRPLVFDLTVLGANRIELTLATASDGSVKPTEVLMAALSLEEAMVPLIQIHKLAATFANGDDPMAAALARAEGSNLETRDSDCWRPAGDPRGDPGG